MTARPPLTDAELAELRARAEAVAPDTDDDEPGDPTYRRRNWEPEHYVSPRGFELVGVDPDNLWVDAGALLSFVAACNPATVLRLLDELQRLRESADAERARHERMLAQANAEWAANGDTGEDSEP